MSADLPSLIDQLGAASLEARELLADIRTATKDLRLAVREAQDAREQLDDAVRKMVDADVKEAVKASVDELKAHTKSAMNDATEKVVRKFRELENLAMTGSARGRPASGLDLRDFLRRGDHGG